MNPIDIPHRRIDGGLMQRVVIYRLGSLGDTILALPCFHKIAEVFADAERIVLTNDPVSTKAPALGAVLGNSGLIHRTVAYPIGLRSPAKLLALRRDLRTLGATTLVYLAESRGRVQVYRDIAFFRLCGFGTIIGAPTTSTLLSRQDDAQCKIKERECARLARTLAALGPIDLSARQSWDLRLTAEERRVGYESVQPATRGGYIAINMGGKTQQKDWGDANWRRLLSILTQSHPHLGLLIVGSAEDTRRAADVAKVWQGPVINVCGQLSPRECAAALEQALLFVGHDSGPLHLSAAMDVPCIGLFGDGNAPEEWYPVGECHRIIHRMAGIGAIRVEEVIEAIRAVLDTRLHGAGEIRTIAWRSVSQLAG